MVIRKKADIACCTSEQCCKSSLPKVEQSTTQNILHPRSNMLYKAWRRPREGLAKLESRHHWIERYQKLEQYWQTSYFVAVVFLEIFVRQSNKVRMEASQSKKR